MDDTELTELLQQMVAATITMAANVEIIAHAFERLAAHELGEDEE